MTIGQFDTRITLQRAVATTDGYGQPVVDYVSVAQLWAVREEVSGNEAAETNRVQASRSVTFTIRHRPDVTTKHRIVYNDAVHDITGITAIGRRRFLEIQTVTREQ